MHDAALVRVREGGRHLHQDRPDLGRRERTARGQQGRERLPAQKLHDEIDHPAGLPDAIDRNDAGVLELGGRAGFALEPLDELLVERQGERQDLDRYVALQLLLARLEDDGHPAAAQLFKDSEPALNLLATQTNSGNFDLLSRTAAAGSRVHQIKPAEPPEFPAAVVWVAQPEQYI